MNCSFLNCSAALTIESMIQAVGHSKISLSLCNIFKEGSDMAAGLASLFDCSLCCLTSRPVICLQYSGTGSLNFSGSILLVLSDEITRP